MYTHENMRTDLLKIVREMAQVGFKPDFIFGIARGGLVPATYLSHYFNVPMFAANFEKERTENDEFDIIASALKQNKKILMVDEICDVGTTLHDLWNIFYRKCPELAEGAPAATVVERNLCTAVLIHNAGSDLFVPDFTGTVINKNESPCWVIFDWEKWS
jgi:hypoxanthine phosphoribosyltransferase